MGKIQKISKVIIVFMLWFVIPQVINGEPVEDMLKKQLDTMDFSSINQTVNKIKTQTDNPYIDEFDFKEIVKKTVKGKIDISITGIIIVIGKFFFFEIGGYLNLIGKLLLISMLCAFLSNLAQSFQSKSTSQVGFYVCYIVLIILLLQSFQIALQVAQSTVETMVLIMQSILPSLLTLMMASGGMTSGAIFEPIVLFSVQTIAMFIKSIILPVIFFTAILGVVNSLSGKEVLKKMMELFEQITDWSLKGISILFIGIMGVHGLTAPVIDGAVNRAAKTVVGVVPVVGETLTGAVDIVMNCSLIIKNAVGIGAIILICIYCLIPIIKMVVFVFVYKVTAALIEPISDKRVVNCISDMGQTCTRLFSCVLTVSLLFIIAITILIGVGSMTAIR